MKNNSPAILFYYEDFTAGTVDLTDEEVGQYMRLLCCQNSHGHMSEEYVKRVVPNCSPYVLEKFVKDKDGNYYNKRMEEEIKARCKFVESRRSNGKKGASTSKASEKHKQSTSKASEKLVENENVNVNEDANTNKYQEEIEKIISYLNSKIGTNFKPTTKKTVRQITARFEEKYTVDDFITVIDKKVASWLGTDMEKHLTPDTLFAPSHFDTYLNELTPTKKRKATGLELAQELEEAQHGTQRDWSDVRGSQGSIPERLRLADS